ncbi:MAG: glucose-6-phosphate isomerase [Maricaulaceae bacterium]|jgi:glucose-6-phosphate isomerase
MSDERSQAWAKVFDAADAASARRLADDVRGEAGRFDRLTLEPSGLYLDLAKQPLDAATFFALIELAHACDLEAKRDALFAGAHVNPSEDRPALHMALRGSTPGVVANGEDVSAFAEETRARVRAFAEAVRSGTRTGATGRRLTQVLHIGIGGSDLGPRLVAEALMREQDAGLTLRFAGNVDPAEINDAISGLDPEATLVVVVSKSFTTQETRLNAEAARAWLTETLGDKAGAHVAAVTARPDRATEFGVAEDAIFPFRDWVGGRYSVWSAVSLALDICLGPETIDAFRAGAGEMDAHFKTAPLEANAPVLMALTDVLNRSVLGRSSRCVVPYSRRLRLLPAYLQQLEMESNGKGVTLTGGDAGLTSQVVWGAKGTNAQHAFFQQLHQGPDVVPVDFIGVLADAEARPEMHRALLANLFAQSEALLVGDPDAAAPHKRFPGDRPSSMLLLDRLDARALGALLALYEHKVFAAAAIWDINPFDQWGVELGKIIAGTILPELAPDAQTAGKRDPSTAALINRARRANGSGG